MHANARQLVMHHNDLVKYNDAFSCPPYWIHQVKAVVTIPQRNLPFCPTFPQECGCSCTHNTSNSLFTAAHSCTVAFPYWLDCTLNAKLDQL